MNCNIVKDLLPLYIDGCCSEESSEQVREHLAVCGTCKQFFDDMSTPANIVTSTDAPKNFSKINDWKASILQSVLLFLSFALITVGVAHEAGTTYDNMFNGLWAINVVVPSTGFMLSLANWYFVKLYKSRKSFSNYCALITFFLALGAFVWCNFHYETDFSDVFACGSIYEFFDVMQGVVFLFRTGIFLTAVFCVLSKVLSRKYAEMLGKQ